MRARNHGVTLLELMIVVAVVAILAGIAYPNYRAHVMRSNRSEARTALMQAAQSMEQCYTHRRSYLNCPSVKAGATSTGLYSISFAVADITDHTFTLTAKPTPLKGQAADAECAQFQITNVRTSAAKADMTDNSTTCWR